MVRRPRQSADDVNLRSGPQMLEYEAIAARIATDPPGRLLDWGCGFGQMTALLLAAGLDVVAFDYRPDAAREGLQPLAGVAGTQLAAVEAHISRDPRSLPFAADSFTAALSCGVLEHVADPDVSLDELRRVLAAGGTLYVYKLPNRFSYLETIARVTGRYYHGALPDDAVYDRRGAVALLERHGFAVRERRRANMLPLTSFVGTGRHLTKAVWTANRALARVPGLNLLATNLELVATAPR